MSLKKVRMESIPISASQKSLTLLVAEDDEDDRNFIKNAWEEGCIPNDLRFVEDGEELTDYLSRMGKYSDPASSPRPTVILLDLNMPRKNGHEALLEIKSNPKFSQIPIIVLTSSKAEEDICRSYDCGANSFIIKPVTHESLVYVLGIVEKYWLKIVRLAPENIGK
jgi:two-component system, response regulator